MSKEQTSQPTFEQALVALLETNTRLVARLEAIEGGNTAAAAHQRMKEMMTPPAPEPAVVKDCLSPDTGCTWDAVISPQTGKVFCLQNVRLPKGHAVHVKNGGLVPDSIPVFNGNKQIDLPKNAAGLDESVLLDRSILDIKYKQWVFSTLTQPDRLRFVGKPLPEYVKPKAS